MAKKTGKPNDDFPSKLNFNKRIFRYWKIL